jgi:hypothetical protein
VSVRLACCALVAAAITAAIALPSTALGARCDGAPTRGCLLPFPNDATQTKADSGRRPGAASR